MEMFTTNIIPSSRPFTSDVYKKQQNCPENSTKLFQFCTPTVGILNANYCRKVELAKGPSFPPASRSCTPPRAAACWIIHLCDPGNYRELLSAGHATFLASPAPIIYWETPYNLWCLIVGLELLDICVRGCGLALFQRNLWPNWNVFSRSWRC